MEFNEVALAYEHILQVLGAQDKGLAKALVNMGIPYGMLQGDPYFKKHYAKWVRNARDNYGPIMAQSRKRDICVSSLPVTDTPAIVCGSGYSLTKAIPYLQQWKGEIFCGNSNVFTLLANGIIPTYVCVYDSHPLIAELLTRYRHWPPEVKLITHVCINPVLIRKWRNPAYYYLVRRQHMEFFDWTLPSMYEDVKIQRGLAWRICVVNNEVQLAAVLGTAGRPVFLIGCDFGWKDRAQWRCRTYEPSKDGHALLEKQLGSIDSANPELGMDENGYEYTGDMIVLRDELHRLWWGNTVSIIDCSGGSLRAFPTADIADVVRLQGQGWRWVFEKRQEISKGVADYLNRRVAAKQEQYDKLRMGRVRDANVRRTDSDGTVDAVADVVGGDTGDEGQAGPGS